MLLGLLCILWPSHASTQTRPPASSYLQAPRAEVLADFAAAAAQVFRGRCVASRPVERQVAGARLRATTYSFEITEGYKGLATRGRFEFTQVGTPEGGPTDLGTLAGLPTYAPGEEYVLFVLPSTASGLTSPAGAGEAAFLVVGETLTQVGSRHGPVRLRAGLPALGPSAPADRSAMTLDTVRQLFGLGGRP